jgi:GTPase SAR1 family protein
MSEIEIIPAGPQAGMAAEGLDEAAQQAGLLADGLEELAGLVGGQLGLTEPAGNLALRATSLRADRFRIVVVGGFSRGKSTLLNAMLGTDLLPQKAVPATAIITLLEYAAQPGVRVRFTAEGAPDDVLSVEEFRSRYVLSEEDINDGEVDTDRFSRIDHAVVSYPIELCRHRVELVDSPGLQDDPARTKRTIGFLRRADAVVMVLDATTLLTEDEIQFLETVLLPEGFRNIFFVINKWNLIEEFVLRPSDVPKQIAELEARIQMRLVPFCQAGLRNLSAERIFRVNAFGALRGRMRDPRNTAYLAATNVPAFEEALQRFLINDRRGAKTAIVLGTVKTVEEEVQRYLATQEALGSKSLEEVEAELGLLQPKLERLRSIRRHIEGFLDSQSANLQDRLAISFQHHVDKIEAKLPEEVEAFDLSEILAGSLVWKALTDWARADENKFAQKVKRCIEPQVKTLLARHFTEWRERAVKKDIEMVTQDVDKHLHAEAEEYRRVMRDIEEQLGVQGSTLDINALVEIWMHPPEGEGGQFELSGIGAFGDMGWLIGSIAVDIAAEVVMHMTFLWLPIVGLIISAIRMLWREGKLRQSIREKIVENTTEGLRRLSHAKAALIRDQVRSSFEKLRGKITGSINEEIAVVEASLQSIIDRKRSKELSVDEERRRLAGVRAAVTATIARIRAAAV